MESNIGSIISVVVIQICLDKQQLNHLNDLLYPVTRLRQAADTYHFNSKNPEAFVYMASFMRIPSQ